MKKRTIRILSIVLVCAMTFTGMPLAAFADELQNLQATTGDIGFDLNGGSFVTAYTEPTTYPIDALPTEEDVTNPGYEFEGWYDNKDFQGEVMTVETVNAHEEESIVMYAKWQERFYVGDIPVSVDAGGETMSIGVQGGGFYENDRVDISVASANAWKLSNNGYTIDYTVSAGGASPLANEDTVATLGADEKQTETDMSIAVGEVGESAPAGAYSDVLTFSFNFTETTYDVTFHTNSGTVYEETEVEGETVRTPITQKTYSAGTSLSDMPYAEKENYIFVGWSLDAEGTEMVNSESRVTGDMELYAVYTEMAPLEKTEIAVSARATDVQPNFTQQVVDNSKELTLNEVKAALTLKNVTLGEDDNFVITAAGNNTYTLSHKDGWTPGHLYKFTVAENKVGVVSFVGYDSTIDHFDFNVFKEEVDNVSFNQDIKYISSGTVSNLAVTGSNITTLVRSTLQADESGAEEERISGTFRYTGSETFAAGDIFGVYEGDVMPEIAGIENTITTEESTVGFYRVISVSDNGTVAFASAETEEILFVPDVLPINRTNPIADGEQTCTISVPSKDLTFSGENELHKTLGLDEDTTIDIGDFVAFQKENDSAKLYGEIVGVVAAVGYYDITFKVVTLEELKSCMDVFHSEDISGDDMLRNTDIPAVEAEVKKQAIKSGLLDEVAKQVEDVWNTTGSYENFQKELAKNTGASTVSVAADSSVKKQAKGEKVEEPDVKIKEVTPRIGKNVKNFNGVNAPSNGVHLDLTIVVEIEMKANLLNEKKTGDKKDSGKKDGVDSLAKFEAGFNIEITLNFVQEICLKSDLGVDAEWGWAAFVPYIKDIKLSAGIKIYEYTGIGLEVEAKFEFGEDNSFGEEAQKYADFFEDAMKNGYRYVSSTDDVKDTLAANGAADYGDDVSIVKSLGKRYSEMLQDIEYQTIFSKEIFTVGADFIHICSIGLTFSFNVDAQMILVAGVNYWYRCGKEYKFSIGLFSRKVSSDTVDLIPEEQEFNAYIMGSAGIRSYINVFFGIKVSGIGTVGLSADVGGYIELYGFLYYTKHKTNGKVTNEQLMGNLYCEIGIYLDVRFVAKMCGAVNYCPTIFSWKKALLKLGNEKVVVDFDYTADDLFDCKMKGIFCVSILPEYLYRMQYLDMDDGLDENGKYFVRYYEPEDFKIEITNPAFSFDPVRRIICCEDTTSSSVQDGELIITYKPPKGYMCKNPIQRRIKLHWDKLRDGYFIGFISNGGTEVPMLYGKYETAIEKPADPTRQGYIFGGWYKNEDLSGFRYTVPDKMPDDDITLYAKWIADDTPYTVERYLQNLDGTYSFYDSDSTATGKTDSQVTPEPESIQGYVTPAKQTQTVNADGSTVFPQYYGLSEHQINFYSCGELVAAGTYKYGDTLPSPIVFNPGYSFKGWKVQGTDDSQLIADGALVPAQATNYEAVWTPRNDIGYEVRYYFQSPNDSTNTVAKIVTGIGSADDVITVEPLTQDETYGYTLRGGVLPTGKIAADGSTVIRVFYDRLTFDLTCVLNNGQSNKVVGGVRHGAYVVPDTPYKNGYDFAGWFTDAACTEEFDFLMPMESKTVYAKWTPGNVTYRVEHYLQGGDGYILKEATVETAKAETEITPVANTYEGYTAGSIANVTPATDGSTVVKIYYDTASYTLTMNYDGTTEQKSLKFGEALPVVKVTNQKFTGWFTDQDYTQAAGTQMPGHDLTVYAELEASDSYTYAVTKNHYLQNVDGSYSLFASENQYVVVRTSVSSVNVTPNTYEHFTKPSTQRVTIRKADVSVDFYYARETVTVTGVLYEENGTAVTKNYAALYGGHFGTLATEVPTRAGYQFLGWFEDAAFATPYTGETTQAITLYAKWSPMAVMYTVEYALQNPDGTYTVTDEEIFYAKAGTQVTPAVKVYEDHVILPAAQTATVQGDGSLVVRYCYDLYQYRITYNPNNGENNIQTDYRYQQNVTDVPVVTKKGYTFITWLGTDEAYYTIPNNMPDADLAFNAQWSLNTYNIVYDLAGGEVDGNNPTTYTVEDDSFTLINPTRYGYNFAGWKLNSALLSSKTVTVEKGSVDNRTYTAVWTHIPYTITLDANGGTVSSSSVTYYIDSASFTLEQPTRPGYTFAGWKLNNEGTASVSTVIPKGTSGPLSYTATWTENYYTVTYNAYGGNCSTVSSGSNASQKVSYTQVFNLKGSEVFKRTGYIFSGWSTSEGGSKVYSGGQSVSKLVTSANGTLTLYPTWQAISYTVKFYTYNNNSDVLTQTHYYGTSYTVKPGSRNGASFVGWSKGTDTKGNLEYSGSGITKGNVVKDLCEVQGGTVKMYAAWSLTTQSSVTITKEIHEDDDNDENIEFKVVDVTSGKKTGDAYGDTGKKYYVKMSAMDFEELYNYGYKYMKVQTTINFTALDESALEYCVNVYDSGSSSYHYIRKKSYDDVDYWKKSTEPYEYTFKATGEIYGILDRMYIGLSVGAPNIDDEIQMHSATVKLTFSKTKF